MNEKFNKIAKDVQLTKVVLSHGEEKGLTVKDPSPIILQNFEISKIIVEWVWVWLAV